MSICKPHNINCYTDIYYLDMLLIGNYHKIILLHFNFALNRNSLLIEHDPGCPE